MRSSSTGQRLDLSAVALRRWETASAGTLRTGIGCWRRVPATSRVCGIVSEDSTWTSTLVGEGTEGTGPVPWAVGSDAVPDTAGRGPVAVPVAVATEVPVRVMVVFDYLRWSEQDAALVEIQSAFQRSLRGLSVAMRGCWGPFEDSEGLASHFDGGANRLAGTKRIKRLRVDLLTSCAKVLREATGFKPQFLVGLGQGGLVAAVLRWPLVVELTLQARNLHRRGLGGHQGYLGGAATFVAHSERSSGDRGVLPGAAEGLP